MIKIVYACNDGYIDSLFLSILSILRRTKEIVQFYVLTNDFTSLDSKFQPFSQKHEQYMKLFVKSFNQKNDFVVVDCKELYDKYLKGNKNENSVCSPYTNLRLLLDKTNLQGKIIYLDTDIMCCGDIKDLNDIDLNGKSFGANRDYLGRYWHPQTKKYINAGVLSVDLERSRQTHLFEIARQFIYKRKYKLADQTALFKAGKKTNSFLIFPDNYKYNTQQPKMLPNTLLKHFCAGWIKGRWRNIKQTDVDGVHNVLHIHAFDEDYKIWEQTKKDF